MKAVELDIKGVKTNKQIFDVFDFKIAMIYNNIDNYLYISLLDEFDNVVVGFNKLVPNIDYFSLSNNDYNYQLRCIKVNDYAEERDFITPENLNKDYKLFLI